MRTEIFPIALGFDTCYILKGEGVIVLDAGQPNKGPAFLDGLTRASIEPEDVGLILLTHAHWDHMGSAHELKQITGAPLAIHEEEASWVEEANPPLPRGLTPWGRTLMSVSRLLTPFFPLTATRVDLRLTDVTSLDDFGIAGVAIATPGHSPGSISVVLESGEAFVGDLAMNRIPLRLSPGLPILGDDLDEVIRSWRRLLEMEITTVYPAHGEPFSAEVMRNAVAA